MTDERSPLDGPLDAPPMPRVGFVGVGAMGAAMVSRLLSLGYRVAVTDADPQREAQAVGLGAMACASPAGVAASCDVLVMALADAASTHAALFGPRGAADDLPAGAAVLLCAALAPADTEAAAAALQARGFDCLDAPMSGSVDRAREGKLSLLLACPQEAMTRHRTVLAHLASRVQRVSERPGDATRMQLVNALLAGIHLAGAAEAMALAERLGLNLPRTLEVIEQSSGQSWIGSDRLRRAIRGDYMPRSPMQQTRQDTALALAMARAAEADTPLGEQAVRLFEMACERGLGAMDDASVFELLRPR